LIATVKYFCYYFGQQLYFIHMHCNGNTVIMSKMLVTKRCLLGWLILKMSLLYCSETENACLNLNKNHTAGKKLPVFPLKIMDDIGTCGCFKECQRVSKCLVVNYNTKHFICDIELIGQKSDFEPPSDGDFIHMELYVNTSLHDTFMLIGDMFLGQYSKF
jgi:hypothetical protein